MAILIIMATFIYGVILFENYVNYGVPGLIISLVASAVFPLMTIDWGKLKDRIWH